MRFNQLTPDIFVSGQIAAKDIEVAAGRGVKSIIINRPDDEADGQPSRESIEAAAEASGLPVRYIPVMRGAITDADVAAFSAALTQLPKPALAFCASGARSASLWALSQVGVRPTGEILAAAASAGVDLSAIRDRLGEAAQPDDAAPSSLRDIVIVGGGAGGIAVAASILSRRRSASITIVEPSDVHYYQPGWTLVGGGVFEQSVTRRGMADVMPAGVAWIKGECADFNPDRSELRLTDGTVIGYRMLVMAPGLKLDWGAVEGLSAALGRNGVTSNYRYDLAPYTWRLVESLKGGKARFTQPPMPIKCAGAPQKAMYLACDAWRRNGVAGGIDVSFHNAGGVLFGVKEYVPALMEYVERYGIDLRFNENLVAVDGDAKEATFEYSGPDGVKERRTETFEMLHVCPPQTGLDVVRNSPLSNDAGWIDIDKHTMRHVRYPNVFALGDAGSTPNAKTAAAVRRQAPVVAHNVIRALDNAEPDAIYNGYGSCPLTVERGRIVLAEFAYDGKLDPTFPRWVNDGLTPTRRAWFLKQRMLPDIYFNQMLRGIEWLAKPQIRA
ncbi:MAG: TIGR01244 family phosphatase [Alphaproteobacteria bacterium]|nr:TIGR01244 family phosphatase [Alphaproteobacteria bacterium]